MSEIKASPSDFEKSMSNSWSVIVSSGWIKSVTSFLSYKPFKSGPSPLKNRRVFELYSWNFFSLFLNFFAVFSKFLKCNTIPHCLLNFRGKCYPVIENFFKFRLGVCSLHSHIWIFPDTIVKNEFFDRNYLPTFAILQRRSIRKVPVSKCPIAK